MSAGKVTWGPASTATLCSLFFQLKKKKKKTQVVYKVPPNVYGYFFAVVLDFKDLSFASRELGAK